MSTEPTEYDYATYEPEDPLMWLAGNEDGDVLLYCSRRECLMSVPWSRPGRLFWFSESIAPCHAQPSDVVDAWEAHKATHLATPEATT